MRYREILESRVAYKGHDFLVIESPSTRQIASLLNQANEKHGEGLRAIISQRSLFVWDGYFMTHHEASSTLGLEDSSQTPKMHLRDDYVELDVTDMFYVSLDEVRRLADIVHNNSCLKSFYGPDFRIMVDDGNQDAWLEDYTG